MYIKNPGGIPVIIYKVIKYFIEERLKVSAGYLAVPKRKPVFLL